MVRDGHVMVRLMQHLLLWVVAGLAVAGGFCCDSKGPNPPLLILTGSFLVGAAFSLGFWLARVDRDRPMSFFKVTYFGVSVWVCMFFGVSAILTPIFKSARAASSNTTCSANGKQLGLALLIYAADFDDRLPLKGNWRMSSRAYQANESADDCPLTQSKYDFAMNRAISGWYIDDIPDPSKTPTLFETTTADPNASGGRESVTYRHGAMFCFANGDARRQMKASSAQFEWNPLRIMRPSIP